MVEITIYVEGVMSTDASKEQKNSRIENYSGYNTEIIFFMIHEMEAWILSQTDKIEVFGRNEGLIRKKGDEEISNNTFLKGKHPKATVKPSSKLDTILRQYFVVSRKRNGKEQKTGKRYSKARDAPKLIGLLDLEALTQTFDEANRMIDYIKMQ